MKAKLCKCNNCDVIMFDDNQGNQPELEAPEETLSMEQVEDTNEGDLERSFFWACPVCMTDAHLQDVTEL